MRKKYPNNFNIKNYKLKTEEWDRVRNYLSGVKDQEGFEIYQNILNISKPKLHDVMDEIDKDKTKRAAEELGFEGYKFTYYIMGEDMRFDRLGKNDIQKLRLKKL